MPFFKQLTDITDEPGYREEIKAALKSANGKKFVYFAKHPKCPKRPHCVLVDFEAGIVKMLGGTPKAEGKVWVEKLEGEKEQIRFEVAKGAMKIRPLKKYLETFYKARAIFVPADEPEEGAEGTETESTESGAPQGELKVPEQMPPLPEVPVKPKEEPPQPQVSEQMRKKIEHEEKQFELRQRIEKLRSAKVPAPLEQLKAQTLLKAAELGSKGAFVDAGKLLEALEQKIAKLDTPAPTKPLPPLPTPPSPKLSTYMNATKEWKTAKAAAGDGVFKLKSAILKECDKELEKLVKAKIDSLNGILGVMDDGIIAKIQEAGNEADEERQAVRNQTLVKVASTILENLRKHPQAGVVDANPFGNFTIRQPVEAALTKIVKDFGG